MKARIASAAEARFDVRRIAHKTRGLVARGREYARDSATVVGFEGFEIDARSTGDADVSAAYCDVRASETRRTQQHTAIVLRPCTAVRRAGDIDTDVTKDIACFQIERASASRYRHHAAELRGAGGRSVETCTAGEAHIAVGMECDTTRFATIGVDATANVDGTGISSETDVMGDDGGIASQSQVARAQAKTARAVKAGLVQGRIQG